MISSRMVNFHTVEKYEFISSIKIRYIQITNAVQADLINVAESFNQTIITIGKVFDQRVVAVAKKGKLTTSNS